MERLSTGILGLDEVLQGGIPRYATVLLAGAPGSGKTIMAQNIAFKIPPESKALYVSTLSEPQFKVLRYQQELSFFDPEAFMERVVFADVGSLIRREGTGEALRKIEELVRRHQPALVMIDSLKAVADILVDVGLFRQFIFDLTVKLSLWECTTLLVGEYFEEDVLRRPEGAIVDGIILLYGTGDRKHQKRYLRVLKMRGTGFLPGEHFALISGDGVQVYPRVNPRLGARTYPVGDGRQSTGIPGLDAMLNGGLPSATTTLVAGSSGTGKTVLALHWLVAGARAGEPGLLATYEENPGEILRIGGSLGWDLQDLLDRGLFKIVHQSPIELDVDRHVHELREQALEWGVRRVVINSISSFEIGMEDKFKYTDYLWGLTDSFKTRGISLMLLCESVDTGGHLELTKHGISYLADSILTLRLAEKDLDVRRLVGVLKMRGSAHVTGLREFVVGGRGIEVLDRHAVLPEAEEQE